MARRSRLATLASSIVLFPLSVALVLLAISNRHTVEIHFWPVLSGLDLPLYLVILGVMVLAFLIGGLVSWTAGHEARRRARSAEREVQALQVRLRTMRLESDALTRIASPGSQ